MWNDRHTRQQMRAWLDEKFGPTHEQWLEQFLLEGDSECTSGRLGDLGMLLPVEEWPAFMRRTLEDGRPGPRRAASGLLQWSESRAADLVQCRLNAVLAADAMHPACRMPDVVRRARMIELVPHVEAAYEEATYSYRARLRAVETLVCLAPRPLCEQYARECLWDCGELIMEIGCQPVGLDDRDVRPRLEFLRDAFDQASDDDPNDVYLAACEVLGS